MDSRKIGFVTALLLVATPLLAQERPYLISLDSGSAKSISGSLSSNGKVCPLVAAAGKSRAVAKSTTSIVLTNKVASRPGAWDDPANVAAREALNSGRDEAFPDAELHPDEIAERKRLAESGPRREAMRKQIKSLEDRREHLQDTMLDDNVDSGTGGEDAVEKEIDDINKQIAKLNEEINSLP